MGSAIKDKKRRRKSSSAGNLLELIAIRHVPQALHVAAVLGIADLIAKRAKGSAELAQATGTDAGILHRILRTLPAAGVLAKDKKERFHSARTAVEIGCRRLSACGINISRWRERVGGTPARLRAHGQDRY